MASVLGKSVWDLWLIILHWHPCPPPPKYFGFSLGSVIRRSSILIHSSITGCMYAIFSIYSVVKQTLKKLLVALYICILRTGDLLALFWFLYRALSITVETSQLNALKSHTSLFFFYDGSCMFRQNIAILRERIFFLLSHFSVNTVGDKS
jgi:hypothetical protein